MRFYVLLGLASVLLSSNVRSAPPLFQDFMGINGHTVQFRPELYAPVARHVRDYHPVEWDLGRESDSTPPFPFARNRVNWETVYGSWKKRDWRIDVCLMFETLARSDWKNLAADSRAYGERFARAFGPSSGLALVEAVEIGNEPGKYSDEDYRIVFESMARGLRAGDPMLKIATCALTTGKSHDYAKSVNCVAGLEDFYDILTVHSYPELEGWPTWRRSFPEDPKLKAYTGDVSALCRWRDMHASGKQVWLTEFGYDAGTRTPDPKTEFKQWVDVTDEQQAQWIVRSWLLFASLPVDRAYLYFFNDSDEPQVHGSSGLTRNFEPKPSFHAAAHLQKTLAGHQFQRNFEIGPARAAEFVDPAAAGGRIWALWLPSGEERTASIELPQAAGKVRKIDRMPLRSGEDTVMTLDGASLRVSESPVYVHLE